MVSRTLALLAASAVVLVPLGSLPHEAANDRAVILVTGFGPFGTYTVNPSQLLVEALNGTMLEEGVVVAVVLPVNFSGAIAGLEDAIVTYHPALVISTGLSPQAKGIEVETWAGNIKREPRGDGTWTFPRRLNVSGPFLRPSTLPVGSIIDGCQAEGMTVYRSLWAGSYVCNAVFYEELAYLDTLGTAVPAGFIHVPLLDTQDPDGMSLSAMVEAVTIAIECSL